MREGGERGGGEGEEEEVEVRREEEARVRRVRDVVTVHRAVIVARWS